MFLVYLGIFSFKNPDQEAWYGLAPGGVNALFNTQEAGTAALATELINIHKRFYIWFLWGFIVMLTVVIFYIVIGLCLLTEKGMEIIITSVFENLVLIITLLSIFSLQGFVWWILGIVWRFNPVGRFSCGDIIPQGTTESAWSE